MTMENETAIRRVVGLADGCELLAAALRWPDEALANALVDGSFADDAQGCLEDAGMAPDTAAALCDRFRCLAQLDPTGVSADDVVSNPDAAVLLADLRRAYSLAHVRQASGVPVFPYESAFLHVAQERQGDPVLFRSPLTLKVERLMREAGVLPAASRQEPCDSVWDEFSFASYLLGRQAEALMADDDAAAREWDGRAREFATDHLRAWVPDFLAATIAELQPQSAEGRIHPAAIAYHEALAPYTEALLELLP